MPHPPQQQAHVEHQREPCPDRIIDDIGGAFGMGAVGGGVWHLIKGLKNSPPGFRVRGALEVWWVSPLVSPQVLHRPPIKMLAIQRSIRFPSRYGLHHAVLEKRVAQARGEFR